MEQNGKMDDVLLKDLEYLLQNEYHVIPGCVYGDLRKQHALTCFKTCKELKGICSLCESHAPSLKTRASFRYAKQCAENKPKSLNTENIFYECPLESFDEQVERLIDKVSEMPKEWTIVQITCQYSVEESLRSDISKPYTTPLHITVFNCGQSVLRPFNINVDVLLDPLGQPVNICEEMRKFMENNKTILKEPSKDVATVNAVAFQESYLALEKHILEIVQMQTRWLGEWRCLFIGKSVDTTQEKKVMNQVFDVIKENSTRFKITQKIEYLLTKITLASEYLSKSEILEAVKYCIPDKDIRNKVTNTILAISSTFQTKKMKRHPVILIVDQKLDYFPWEMTDVLEEHPACRMPSLDFTYALFKEHEDNIVDGYKTVDLTGSSYITNPSLDLKNMEARMKLFCKYWIPDWKEMTGKTPTPEEFVEYLTSGGVFIYNGHGSGVQYASGGKIQQIRLNTVVLLFGCGSLRKQDTGPLVEMHDLFYNYLIACSPCVLGMLWNVGDFNTDLLSTELISFWVPSNAKVHWKLIDKMKWNKGRVVPEATFQTSKYKVPTQDNEPELLRAMNLAKTGRARFITRAGLIAKGLPVKIVK